MLRTESITEMPNNPHEISWNSEEFEKLVELVKPHSCLYNVQDPSRKNILAREATWEQISRELCKPVEDCKKRWKALRDGYMKTQRMGKIKSGLFTKLDFLDEPSEETPIEEHLETENIEEETEQEVIMDKQEYYEIMLVENPEASKLPNFPKLLLPPRDPSDEPPKKLVRKNCRRKKLQQPPPILQPVKILPKPIVMNSNFIQYVEEKPKVLQPPPPQPKKSEILDNLIEKVLKEHTNEIDVFFRSMAASVKKLQPNLIPKVKMEVCNVIAKYEMQSFEKNGSF